jgi:hypothetical protein
MTSQPTHQSPKWVEVISHGFAGDITSTRQGQSAVESHVHGFAGGITSTRGPVEGLLLSEADFWRAVAVEVLATLSSCLR